MVYVPSIRDYKPFYIQVAGTNPAAWDTRTYGLIAQSQPYPDNAEAKDPYKNEWMDESGDDEYLGQVVNGFYVGALHLKAFTFEVKFYLEARPDASSGKSAVAVLNERKRAFRRAISNGEISTYDSWQEIGYTSVRFVKDEVEKRKISEEKAWMIFSVTFKVNDPKAYGVLNYNNGVYTIDGEV